MCETNKRRNATEGRKQEADVAQNIGTWNIEPLGMERERSVARAKLPRYDACCVEDWWDASGIAYVSRVWLGEWESGRKLDLSAKR